MLNSSEGFSVSDTAYQHRLPCLPFSPLVPRGITFLVISMNSVHVSLGEVRQCSELGVLSSGCPSHQPPLHTMGLSVWRAAVNQSLCKGGLPQRSKKPLRSGKILGHIACHFRTALKHCISCALQLQPLSVFAVNDRVSSYLRSGSGHYSRVPSKYIMENS